MRIVFQSSCHGLSDKVAIPVDEVRDPETGKLLFRMAVATTFAEELNYAMEYCLAKGWEVDILVRVVP